MTNQDIRKIELELEISLPEYYKRVALNNPFADKQKYPTMYSLIIDSAEELIEINKKLRVNGYKKKPWPNNLFVFGYQIEENYFFFDLMDKETENIYDVDPEKRLFDIKKVMKYRSHASFDDLIWTFEVIHKIKKGEEAPYWSEWSKIKKPWH